MGAEYEIAKEKDFKKRDLEDVLNIEKIKAGDLKSYNLLFNKYQKIIFRQAKILYNGREDEADELTSEVLIKISNTIEKYSVENGSGNFGGWVRKMTKNAFLDKKRKNKQKFIRIDDKFDLGESEVSTIQIKETSLNIEENLISKELNFEMNERLKKVIETLKEEERKILHLRFELELSFEEIAKELNKTVNYCLVKLHRIKEKLKKRF